MRTRIDEQTADQWAECAKLWKTAEQALSDLEALMHLNMGQISGKPIEAVNKAIECVHGNAYMFTPQSEWVGGDESDPRNTVYVEPHICRS